MKHHGKFHGNHHGSVMFVISLTLFTVFALFMMLTLLTGASTFRNISANAEERFNERTPLLYFANRVRNFDEVQITQIGNNGDTPALRIDGGFWQIYMYLHEGHIREYLTIDGTPTRLDLGVAFFPADCLQFTAVSDNLLQIQVNGRSIFANVEVVQV
jgi:hypothetical protein